MATVLDTGLLQFFLPVFAFLLVLVVTYAILQKTDILKSKSVNMAAAFAIAVLFLFTPDAIEFLQLTTPWFVIFLVMLLIIFSTFMFLGVKEDQINSVLAIPSVYWTILVIIVAIFLFGFTKIFGEQVQGIFGEGNTDEGGLVVDIGRIIFHPRMLGAIFILLVASQVIRLIVPKK